jgi:hypothetical protein
MDFRSRKRIGFVILCILLNTACARQSIIQETQTTATNVPLPTLTSSATPTITSVPVVPTNTPVPSQIGPTLQPTERALALLDLMHTNGGCDLPCALGITPGQTSYEDTKRFLERMGWQILEKPPASGRSLQTRSVYGDSSLTAIMELRERNGVVENLHLALSGYQYLQLVEYYQLLHTLTREGVPTQAWIFLPPGLQDMPVHISAFQLFIYYAQKNMLLEYEGVARIQGDQVRICPPRPWLGSTEFGPETGDVGVYIGPGAKPMIPEDLTRTFGFEIIPFIGEKYQVQNMLGMDVDAFTQDLLTRKEAACYDIPKSTWP